MDKEKFDLEIRLIALEYMAAHTLNLIYRIAHIPDDIIAQVDAQGREMLSKETFPGIDPALADHAADEIAEAVSSIKRSAAEMRAAWAQKHTP